MINEAIIKRKGYCCEDISLIENFEKAKRSKEQWVIHHRLEIQDGKLISKKELLSMNLYYNRPASELIFMPYSEHSKMHMSITRKFIYTSVSDDTKTKLSNAAKHYKFGVNKTESQLNKIWRKFKWMTPQGEIRVMCKQQVMRYHPDWKLIE